MEFINVLTLDEMPEYRSELAGFDVSFPKLSPAHTSRHQQFIKGLMQYLNCELGMCMLTTLPCLFGPSHRSATWAGSFSIPPGFLFMQWSWSARGRGLFLPAHPKDDLTPEQAMLAEYHACY